MLSGRRPEAADGRRAICGWTIASKHDSAKGGYLPALSGEDLVSGVPAIKKIAQIQVEQISNIPSDDITPEIWGRLLEGRVNFRIVGRLEYLVGLEITRQMLDP